jgi:hypothetical protein
MDGHMAAFPLDIARDKVEVADPNARGAIIVITDEMAESPEFADGWKSADGWTLYQRLVLAGFPEAARTQWLPVTDSQIMDLIADGFIICDPDWVQLRWQVKAIEL